MADNYDENGYDAWLDHVNGNCDIDIHCQYCAEEKEEKRVAIKSKKRKYWYYISSVECVLCGKIDETRERRYTKKPKASKRYNHEQNACSVHFL